METDPHSEKFTTKYDKLGYVLFGVLFLFFLTVFVPKIDFIISADETPLYPGVRIFNLLDIFSWSILNHLFILAAFSAIFVSLILSIIRVIKKCPLPKAILRLQYINMIAFIIISVLALLVWVQFFFAYGFWGSEVLLLFPLLAMVVFIYVYFKRSTPGSVKTLLILLAQLAIFILALRKSFYFM